MPSCRIGLEDGASFSNAAVARRQGWEDVKAESSRSERHYGCFLLKIISNLFEIVIFSEKRIFILHIFHIRFQL